MNIALLRKKIKDLEKPLVIFICGMQGTRKSSSAVQLAAKLGIKVVLGTDQIRDIIRLYNANLYLQRSTHQCWELIGERTPENIIFGYVMQSALVRNAVLGALELTRKRGENIIIEGVHLMPELYLGLQKDPDFQFFHFLLWTEDKNLHQENISLKVNLRHGKERDWSKETIENAEEMQKFILSGPNRGVHLISSVNPEANIKAIIKVLEEIL